ncbi:MAG TPA: acetamidase/formamidase family protein, partial [Candidatus Binataceae bacterium]|nr:acetamidase/formamidase family protein [Candidatus Binataceae bacterium]
MSQKVREVRLDKNKRLALQAAKGHNRWHPDIPPVLRIDPGDEVVLDTLDGVDRQILPTTRLTEVAECDLNVAHPLTGPIWINGAEAGDLLEVQLIDIIADDYGWTAQLPGFGFLRDLYSEPHLVRWQMASGLAESDDLPGVRIPEASFPGVIGLAPSHDQLQRIRARESAAAERGGFVLPPDPRSAIPGLEPIASQGLRTIPPRETGGNLDIKQLVKGTAVYLPVWTEGALFSIGDAHFAQGDGEVCGTAIEMAATFHVRFELHKG